MVLTAKCQYRVVQSTKCEIGVKNLSKVIIIHFTFELRSVEKGEYRVEDVEVA